MGLRIQNNIAAMNTHRQLTIADSGMSKSLERLSSGFRINRAADDAAGLAISQQFRADIASFKVASRNTTEAGALLQVAEGAMEQIGNMLTRLKELATQSASANVGSANRSKLEAEKDKLVDEIERISQSTKYGGTQLLDGSFGDISSTWDNTLSDSGEKVLNTSNNQILTFTDNSTAPTLSFTFNASPILTEQAYTFSTVTDDAEISLEGADGSVFRGTFDNTTITFSDIGLTIVGAAALTTANLHDSILTISNSGFLGLAVESSTATGDWHITATAGGQITLKNVNDTSITQSVINVVDGPQTLDFDQLGIKLSLGTLFDVSDTALHTVNFNVNNSQSATFQVGANNSLNDRISISIGDTTAGINGLNLTGTIDLTSATGAQSALDVINSAIDILGNRRGAVGAAMNRLSYASANLSITIENVQAAESVIRDVDMAAEMTTFTKNQILLQASTAMLAQANMAPQSVLSLFG